MAGLVTDVSGKEENPTKTVDWGAHKELVRIDKGASRKDLRRSGRESRRRGFVGRDW